MGTNAAPAFDAVTAQPGWGCVDFISDLHLQPSQPATFEAWRHYMLHTPASAVFILGDLFEAWVGDDGAQAPGFAADCAQVLEQASARRPALDLFFLHGNRDFLVSDALAHRCRFTLMADPAVLHFAGRRWLLTHGDALCLDDVAYLRFRNQVRTPQWTADFLAQPLAAREEIARRLRSDSQAHHAQHAPGHEYADADADMARAWLAAAGSDTMIHGHTHRPADHDLGGGLRRIVLCDWDATATPPRAQALRAWSDGRLARIALA